MDKSKERGQALIEFVLLLPIIIFLILSVIDIGKIIYTKTNLESKMNDVVQLVRDGKNNNTQLEKIINKDNNKITVKLKNKEDIEIVLSTEVKFITPGFNIILDNPYNINVKRIIEND